MTPTLKKLFIGTMAFVSTTAFAQSTPSSAPQPTHMLVSTTPWQLTPNGDWRSIIQIQYKDSSGQLIPLTDARNGISIDNGGALTELAEWTEHDNAGIITLTQSAPVTIKTWSLKPHFPILIQTISPPPDDLAHFQVVATPVGPYANAIGWTPLNANIPVVRYEVWRLQNGQRTQLADVSNAQHSYYDNNGVQPNQKYTYEIDVDLANQAKPVSAQSGTVTSSGELPTSPISNFNGIGMLIFFNPDAKAPNSFTQYPIDEVVKKAKAAKLNFIEFQVQYGEFSRINSPDVAAWFDQLLQALHQNGIKVIAWIVPRSDTIETSQQVIQLLNHKTAGGDHFDGVALDIEPGDPYMGSYKTFPGEAIKLVSELKAAVGPNYPLTAIVPVPTPYTSYPYAAMGKYIDLAAPMVFWHDRLSKQFNYTQDYVTTYCQNALTLTDELFEKKLPLVMIGQSANLGEGTPSANEIIWSLQAAKNWNAKGVAFFDWSGIRDDSIWDILSQHHFS